MNAERTLTNSLSIGRKIGMLIEHLQRGGEVEIDGYTYVWLNNHITRTTTDEKGETHYFGIDGLAIKMTKICGSTGEESPYYVGQVDLSIQSFINMTERIKEIDWLGMCAGNALQSMNKKR
ncbi:hypothetical protein [Metabacillus sp. SLBN-84]